MVKRMRCAAALLAALLAAAAAGAAEPPLVKELEPCRPDVGKFCPAVKPGGGRIVECLQRHEKQLSAACTRGMTQFRLKRRPALTASRDSLSG